MLSPLQEKERKKGNGHAPGEKLMGALAVWCQWSIRNKFFPDSRRGGFVEAKSAYKKKY